MGFYIKYLQQVNAAIFWNARGEIRKHAVTAWTLWIDWFTWTWRRSVRKHSELRRNIVKHQLCAVMSWETEMLIEEKLSKLCPMK